MLAATLRQGPDVRLLRPCLGGSRATHQWEWMRQQGHEINPCNSTLHPAVKAGLQPAADQTPVQEAYTPNSICWGCGKRRTIAVLLSLIHYASARQSSNHLRCACRQQSRNVQTLDTSAPDIVLARFRMLITVHIPGAGLHLHITRVYRVLVYMLPASTSHLLQVHKMHKA